MSVLTDAQLDALHDLAQCWSGVPFVLIGGAALALQTDEMWRTTKDLDLTVSVGRDEFPGGIEAFPAGGQENSRTNGTAPATYWST
jgi:hypothetical protein